MGNTWSSQAWKAAERIYASILRHPFVEELAAGRLDRERFEFYIRQDALYLRHYARRLLNVAIHLQNKDDMADFILFASQGIRMEEQLHAGFMADNPIPEENEMTPGCLLYTSVLDARATDPVEIIAASVLPCFWVYQRVGTYIHTLYDPATNPYRAWIELYADDEFARWTQRVCEICDRLAERTTEEMRRRMTETFVLCTKMEWMFWDSAWNLEKWKI